MIRSLVISLFVISLLASHSCSHKLAEDSMGIQTLSIPDFRDYLTDERLTDLATQIEYIPLETSPDCLLDQHVEIQNSDGIYYILSKNEIFRFDSHGRFISRMSNVGNGPGEYSEIRSFKISNHTDELWIISGNNKILKYSKEGNFINSFNPIDTVPNDKWNVFITENQILFDGLYSGGYTAMRYDQSGNFIEPLSYRGILHGTGRKSFFNRGIDILYKTKYCDTIYKITPTQFLPELCFDFGTSSVNWNDRVSLNSKFGNSSAISHRFYNVRIQDIADNYLIALFTVLNDKKIQSLGPPKELGYNPESHYLLCNLSSGKIKIVPYYGFNDQTNLFLRGGITSVNNGEQFCTYCLPTSLHASRDKIIAEHGEKFFKENYNKLDKLCQMVSAEDNPVLITFSFRF